MGTTIYKILDIGENYDSIEGLNAEFNTIEELEKFLTITNSYFDNLNIEYKGYAVEYRGEKDLTPRIIIEKISKDKSLYLKIGASISTLTYGLY